MVALTIVDCPAAAGGAAASRRRPECKRLAARMTQAITVAKLQVAASGG